MPDSRDMGRDEYTIADIFRLLRRRRRIIINTLTVFLLLVTIYAITAKRFYQATGEIEIQKETSGDFGLQGGVMPTAEAPTDALDYNVTLQTQATILQSDTLALRVIKELDLENKDFYSPANKTVSLIPEWVFFWKKPVEPLSVPIDDAPDRRALTLKTFSKRLSIKPVSGTRLIDIGFLDRDPHMAAEIVNRLIAAFTDYTFNTRFAATAQSSNWLQGQLAELKKQTEDLQAKSITLQRDTGMFGDDQQNNVVLSRLQSLNDSLTQAESNRILKEAVYKVAQSGNAELISGLSGPGQSMNGSPVPSSFTLIQTLRSEEEQARTQLAQDKIKYGPSYPKLISDEAQLADIERAIKAEVSRVEGRAKSDYEIAAQTESKARGSFNSQKQLVNQLNDKAIAYQLAKQEADASSALYEGLLSKLKQAGVLEGVKSSNISIVQPGLTPPLNTPKKPNIPLYYAAGIFAGLFFGIVGAVLVDLRDPSLHSLAEVERTLGVPVLGILPTFGKTSSKLLGGGFGIRKRNGDSDLNQPLQLEAGSGAQADHSFAHGDMAFAEALRSLRTALLLSRSGSPPQVILVTSSLPGEGKSTVSLDLAVAFAQQGGRVLLIDADLRTPTLQKRLGVTDMKGLSAALSNSGVEPAATTLKQVPNLTLMFGGAAPPYPSELLGSSRMRELLTKWRKEYDYIFIDSPPVLPVTDAIVLSQVADATLLLVQHGTTARQAVQRSFRSLARRTPEGAVLGVVVNGVAETSAEYYDYYGYQGYRYTSDTAEKDGKNG